MKNSANTDDVWLSATERKQAAQTSSQQKLVRRVSGQLFLRKPHQLSSSHCCTTQQIQKVQSSIHLYFKSASSSTESSLPTEVVEFEPVRTSSIQSEVTDFEPALTSSIQSETEVEPALSSSNHSKETQIEPVVTSSIQHEETEVEPVLISSIQSEETDYEPILTSSIQYEQTDVAPIMSGSIRSQVTDVESLFNTSIQFEISDRQQQFEVDLLGKESKSGSNRMADNRNRHLNHKSINTIHSQIKQSLYSETIDSCSVLDKTESDVSITGGILDEQQQQSLYSETPASYSVADMTPEGEPCTPPDAREDGACITADILSDQQQSLYDDTADSCSVLDMTESDSMLIRSCKRRAEQFSMELNLIKRQKLSHISQQDSLNDSLSV